MELSDKALEEHVPWSSQALKEHSPGWSEAWENAYQGHHTLIGREGSEGAPTGP